MQKKDIDWELFEKLVWIPRTVLNTAHIADMLKVHPRTLERQVHEKYGETIAVVRDQKQGPMRRSLFAALWKNAMSGQVSAQIWLTKNIFGWHDKVAHTAEKMDDKLVINFGSAKPEQNQDKS